MKSNSLPWPRPGWVATARRLPALALVLVLVLGSVGCALVLGSDPAGAAAADGGEGPTDGQTLEERVARQLIAASPLADPSDARARDRAAAKLVQCQDFLGSVGERLLWGGCEPVKGYDPKSYSLTEFDPFVWLKLYGSTLMFTGEYEVKADGPLSVLDLKARFRSGLDPGEYPYPFWHSQKKWRAYLDMTSLCLVFAKGKIIAAYRVSNSDASQPQADRPWDGRWQWTDGSGVQQPRVALFGYLFGPDNPHRAGVDAAYRSLEKAFRANECTSCHAPDNSAKAKSLLLLNYPNQSLFARHALLRILQNNEMPPGDAASHREAGVADDAARTELLQLAQVFVREADAAVAFESGRISSSDRAAAAPVRR